MALGSFFLYIIGQVDFVLGQVKFEDHLPGGRQFQNLNVEAWHVYIVLKLLNQRLGRKNGGVCVVKNLKNILVQSL